MGTSSWDNMSELEQLSCIYWDLYKDAYGVRPRFVDTSEWTVEQFRAELKVICEVIESQEDE